MTPEQYHEDLRKKVLEGLKLAYQNMVKFKKEKNSVICSFLDLKAFEKLVMLK